MRVPRGHILIVLLVTSVSLAGCASSDDGAGHDAGPSVAPPFDERVVLPYNMTGACDVAELWLEADDPDRFLPDGFDAASAGAPFVVRTETCRDAKTGTMMGLFVRIAPPQLEDRVYANMSEEMAWMEPGRACDTRHSDHRYFVAGYSDAPFWVQRFRQGGIPTVAAAVAQSMDPVDAAPATELAVAEGEATADGDVLFSFDAALRGGSARTGCVSTFFQSDHGLLLVEEVLRAAPVWEGPGVCALDEDHPFGWALDRAACARMSATVARNVQRDGYAFWFHETFVVPTGDA